MCKILFPDQDTSVIQSKPAGAISYVGYICDVGSCYINDLYHPDSVMDTIICVTVYFYNIDCKCVIVVKAVLVVHLSNLASTVYGNDHYFVTTNDTLDAYYLVIANRSEHHRILHMSECREFGIA